MSTKGPSTPSFFLTAGKGLRKDCAEEDCWPAAKEISGAKFGKPQKVSLLVIRSLSHKLMYSLQT